MESAAAAPVAAPAAPGSMPGIMGMPAIGMPILKCHIGSSAGIHLIWDHMALAEKNHGLSKAVMGDPVES